MRIFINILLISFLISCNHRDSKFELCRNKKHPYYYPELKYVGGFYEIKKHFYKSNKTFNDLNNTGIIRVQFDINCYGETGNYSVKVYSLNYEPAVISDSIIKHFLELTKELKDWIPAENDTGEKVDSHKFFAFKVINGKLKDILPK